MPNIGWIIGMVGSVCTALLGLTNVLPETWRPYVVIASVISTAISGYMVQHPPDEAIRGRRAPDSTPKEGGNRSTDPPPNP